MKAELALVVKFAAVVPNSEKEVNYLVIDVQSNNEWPVKSHQSF